MLSQICLTGPEERLNWWLHFLTGYDFIFSPIEGTFYAISTSLAVDCSLELSSDCSVELSSPNQ
jgi:hypothetical protein